VICGECWIGRGQPFGCGCEGLLVGLPSGKEAVLHGRRAVDQGAGAGSCPVDLAGGRGEVMQLELL
jgi:hypothetical protein